MKGGGCLHHGGVEQPGGEQRGEEAQHVKPQHDHGAQADDAAEKEVIGNERGDNQRVDGQARRAGHEGRDHDGGDALALVLDGAGGHDRRHGARVCREQRDEGLAVEPDGTHDAVGDEGGAGEVAGVLQHADEEEEQQDLRQEDEHGLHAVPQAVSQQQAQPIVGQQKRGLGAKAGEQDAHAVRERLAQGKDDLKDGEDHREEDERSGERSSRTESRRRVHERGCGGLIAGARGDLRGPGAAGGAGSGARVTGWGAASFRERCPRAAGSPELRPGPCLWRR